MKNRHPCLKIGNLCCPDQVNDALSLQTRPNADTDKRLMRKSLFQFPKCHKTLTMSKFAVSVALPGLATFYARGVLRSLNSFA